MSYLLATEITQIKQNLLYKNVIHRMYEAKVAIKATFLGREAKCETLLTKNVRVLIKPIKLSNWLGLHVALRTTNHVFNLE